MIQPRKILGIFETCFKIMAALLPFEIATAANTNAKDPFTADCYNFKPRNPTIYFRTQRKKFSNN